MPNVRRDETNILGVLLCPSRTLPLTPTGCWLLNGSPSSLPLALKPQHQQASRTSQGGTAYRVIYCWLGMLVGNRVNVGLTRSIISSFTPTPISQYRSKNRPYGGEPLWKGLGIQHFTKDGGSYRPGWKLLKNTQ